MKAYLTFCSCVYHFYAKKNETIPVFYTLALSSVLITLNVYSIYEIIGFFTGHNLPLTKTIGYGILASVSLINYVGFIHPEKFKEIKPTKKNNYNAVIYIIVSVILIVVCSIIYQNNRVAE